MDYIQLLNVLVIPILGFVFRIHKKMTIIEDTHKRVRSQCCLYTLNCPLEKEQ